MTKREQQEKLFRAIGYVGDDLISRADAPVEKQKANLVWVKWAALAACCVLVIGLASRLPLGNTKSENAVETTTMTMETAAAEEAPAAAEPEETMEEAAAEEAPAEEEAKAEESGIGSRGEPAADEIFDEALEQELLQTTIGPVKLGLPAEEVRASLGAPKEESDELYVCTDKGDFRYIYWRYNLTNDPDYLFDAVLQFADLGDGFILNEIQTFGTSDWALPSGLKNGCSADDVLAVYPDAELTYSGEGADGSPTRTISLQTGHVRLTFLVEGEKITSITLGTYYAESGMELETGDAPAYSFASSDMIVYQKEETGWLPYHMKGQPAKKLEVILGIEDIVPIDDLPQARYYIDFQNGTVVMLGEDRISGAVYTCEDLGAFRAAMDKGEDPTPYLTLIEQAKFPYGTDDVIQELAEEE